jgi:hypothetical protein
MIQAVHHVRGRLRIRHLGIKRDRREAERFCDLVRCFPGVYAASARPITGSVVVEYDWRLTGHEQLIQLLGAAPLARPRQGEKLAEKLGQILVERLIEHSASALIGALT